MSSNYAVRAVESEPGEANRQKGGQEVSEELKLYDKFRWIVADQLLEPAVIEELNEIEQINRAISEISEEQVELYTTS
jgi:hypothetical protein